MERLGYVNHPHRVGASKREKRGGIIEYKKEREQVEEEIRKTEFNKPELRFSASRVGGNKFIQTLASLYKTKRCHNPVTFRVSGSAYLGRC
jgi:hypothetical protein